MKSTNFLFVMISFAMVLASCIVPKESRIVKKSRMHYRDSEIVFQAYADSPFSGTFLTLRKNGTFEFSSSGFLRSFQAGEWKCTGDSLQLQFCDKENIKTGSELYLSDSDKRMLQRDKLDTLHFQGMRIMINSL